MATINAMPGIKTAFSGGADDIVCTFAPVAKGVQVEAQGFTLNSAAIDAWGGSSADEDTMTFTDVKHVGVISSASGVANIGKVRLRALSAGSYFVTFTAI